MSKLAASIVSDAYEAQGQREDTERRDTPIDIGQAKPQASDIAGTSSTPTPPLIVTSQLSIAKSVPSNYVLVLHLILTEIVHRLSIIETKVQLMKGVIKPKVERKYGEEKRMI
ncbi:hypothetical protein FXO38_25740 [Capsicum annuum]|nr:hypothetical protein FXO38_25740 [Capsicum annuum]KAF3684455.1 hypothetical protein FXO37_01324 [Capsicum annuum]